MCIGCRRKAPAAELVRIARLDDGSLAVGRHLPGRGAWLCPASPACVVKAANRRAFGRALRGEVGPAQIEPLRTNPPDHARM
jgi:predicted RNA-binding protein YlxR (DUF448 family)